MYCRSINIIELTIFLRISQNMLVYSKTLYINRHRPLDVYGYIKLYTL